MAVLRGDCRLPEFLLRANMSPAQFARRMGVHQSSVTRWITKERLMTYENAVQASGILDCHAEDFYHWDIAKRKKRGEK